MARSVKAVREWLSHLNSEADVAVYGQGSGAALVACGGDQFIQIGGETRERHGDRQPLQLAIEKLRAVLLSDDFAATENRQAVMDALECLEDGEMPKEEWACCSKCPWWRSGEDAERINDKGESVRLGGCPECGARLLWNGEGIEAANAPVSGPLDGPRKVSREEIERMKRDGYLGAGWTR